MNTLTLQDPQSGNTVHIKFAELKQKCYMCGIELQGTWIANMEGGNTTGWVCLPHLERVLLTAEPSPAFKARQTAKQQLINAEPGDITTVTRSLLVAMEAW